MVELLTRAAAVAIERGRAEAALRKLNEPLEQRVQAETQERLQIWNVSQDLLAVAGLDGKILGVNPAWTATLGWPEADLLGKPYEWFLHPDDREKTHAEVGHLAKGHKTLHFENRLRAKDESYHWISWTAAPDSERIYATGRDITKYKRAEEALRESEGRFRDYAETASDWFWEIGPDYKFTLLTENAFGSDTANRIGTACWYHALDLETEPEKWRRVQETLDARKPFRDFVYCSVRGDGSPMYVRASGKPVFDTNGVFRGYRGTGTDVTAIIRTQDALRESERRLRSAMDGIPGLFAVLSPNGEVEALNRQIVEYCGGGPWKS
jgi:PAS domain S-box-containing protein